MEKIPKPVFQPPAEVQGGDKVFVGAEGFEDASTPSS